MISIIICSINPGYLSQVEVNIAATIGVEYELLAWDNREEKKGICEVYNQMAGQARYDLLCFLHEDILFETAGWGQSIARIFSGQPRTGVIGVAGTRYKSAYFSGWYTGNKLFDCAHITHRFPWGDEVVELRPPGTGSPEEVVCIDGVFICCRKTIWEQVRFDEKLLTGFHFYDIDFSIRASLASSVVVTFDIMIIHITTGGDFGENWVQVAMAYHADKKNSLPHTCMTAIPANAEKAIIKTWLDVLKNYKINWNTKWQWIRKQELLSRPSLYYSIVKFLIYQPLGLRRIHKSRNQK